MSLKDAAIVVVALSLFGCAAQQQNPAIDRAPMSGESKDSLRRYFAMDARPKVFAFAPRTGASWHAWGYPSVEETRAIALSKCEELGSACEIYAINDTVVWKKK